MEENDAELMHQQAAVHVAARIPNRHLERVVVYDFASLVQHVLPREAPSNRRCYVEHWNISVPAADSPSLNVIT